MVGLTKETCFFHFTFGSFSGDVDHAHDDNEDYYVVEDDEPHVDV